MKTKLFSIFLALIFILITLSACNSEAVGEIKNDFYFLATEDADSFNVPYIHFNTENKTFSMSGGIAISYAISGTYEIDGDVLTAKYGENSYSFEIKDDETLVLTQLTDTEYLKLKVGDEFKFRDLKSDTFTEESADFKIKQANNPLNSYYFLVTDDVDNFNVPYFNFNTVNSTFHFSSGIIDPYVIDGTYEIIGNHLTATSGENSYSFKIMNDETLFLFKFSDYKYWNLKVGDEFIYTAIN